MERCLTREEEEEDKERKKKIKKEEVKIQDKGMRLKIKMADSMSSAVY